MDGRDMQRSVDAARRAKAPRESAEALRRSQGVPSKTTAEDCLDAGRDPERKLEPLRRALGDGLVRRLAR